MIFILKNEKIVKNEYLKNINLSGNIKKVINYLMKIKTCDNDSAKISAWLDLLIKSTFR